MQIIEVLYKQKGFRGNAVDYYDDDNSMINKVLLNRAGERASRPCTFRKVVPRRGGDRLPLMVGFLSLCWRGAP